MNSERGSLIGPQNLSPRPKYSPRKLGANVYINIDNIEACLHCDVMFQ